MAGERANWDDDVSKIFLQLCIAEKKKLNWNFKRGLTKTGWKNLYRNFYQQTGRKYDRKQLQNKFNSLKRLFKVWKKLRNSSGARCDNNTRIIVGEKDWWADRIAENPEAEQFRQRPLPHEHEMTILFANLDTEEGDKLCAGGAADRTPSGESNENLAPVHEDNVSRSSVGRLSQRPGKEHAVDSPPLKRTRSMEYYVEHILKSMLERSRNETSALKQEQDEVQELLQVVENDGVDQGSELFFIAIELFRSPARRAAFRALRAPQNRIAWLQWTWDNARKK